VLRVEYRITYSKSTVPFRICYCLTEVLYDCSDHVKASVLWRHGQLDFIGFYWDPYEMSVTSHSSSGVAEFWLMSPYFLHNFITSGVNIPEPPVIKTYRYSSTYVRTMAVVHRTSYQPPPPKKCGHRPQIILPQADARRPHTPYTRPTAANQRLKSWMTVCIATTWKHQHSDVMIDVISVDPTRFHTFKVNYPSTGGSGISALLCVSYLSRRFSTRNLFDEHLNNSTFPKW
jgi:hypothetical protein